MNQGVSQVWASDSMERQRHRGGGFCVLRSVSWESVSFLFGGLNLMLNFQEIKSLSFSYYFCCPDSFPLWSNNKVVSGTSSLAVRDVLWAVTTCAVCVGDSLDRWRPMGCAVMGLTWLLGEWSCVDPWPRQKDCDHRKKATASLAV